MKRFIFYFILMISVSGCSNHHPSEKTENDESPKKQILTGAQIYQYNCTSCHGAAGNLGMSGAKNLQNSTLSKEDIIKQVTYGKGMMSAFKSILSPEEIDKVADYVITLR